MKKIFYMTILFAQTIFLNGQNGYYVINDKMAFGDKLIDAGAIKNSQFCTILKNGKLLTFPASEVSEYGFKNGRVYSSKIIDTYLGNRGVFLERLCKGTINLYYYRGKKSREFFIEKNDGPLVAVPKKSDGKIKYREVISGYLSDINGSSEAVRRLTYYRPAFISIIDQYNSGAIGNIPSIKYGVSIGGSLIRPVYKAPAESSSGQFYLKQLEEDLGSADFKWNKALLFSLSLDLPILKNKYSFHPEVNLEKNEFSSLDATDAGRFASFDINAFSISVPLLIRYTSESTRVKSFFNAGGVLAYNSIQFIKYYTGPTIEDLTEQTIIDNNAIYPAFHMGFAAGAGVIHEIIAGKSASLELRYNRLFGLGEKTSGNNSIRLLLGINFQ